MTVEVLNSPIHGRGCFAGKNITAGARILEYTGRHISLKEANERYWERPTTYLFALNDGTVIDGLGIASFVNHSCDPNCRAEEDDGRVWICSLRDIKVGEELTFDYKLKNSGLMSMPCRCGSRNCRGSMFSAEELKRRRKRGQMDELMTARQRPRVKTRKRAAKHKAKSHGSSDRT
jgi:SET domain-containing protein